MPRPPGRAAFAAGHACSALRLAPRSPLVLAGPDGFVEASVTSQDNEAAPPLRCTADDLLLFRLTAYVAAADALVAFGPGGAPLATFLRRGLVRPEVAIRDETSAPVAKVDPDLLLIETGGRVLGDLSCVDVEREDWVDDQWMLSLVVDERDVPLRPLALVALPLAAKVLLGRRTPVALATD